MQIRSCTSLCTPPGFTLCLKRPPSGVLGGTTLGTLVASSSNQNDLICLKPDSCTTILCEVEVWTHHVLFAKGLETVFVSWDWGQCKVLKLQVAWTLRCAMAINQTRFLESHSHCKGSIILAPVTKHAFPFQTCFSFKLPLNLFFCHSVLCKFSK